MLFVCVGCSLWVCVFGYVSVNAYCIATNACVYIAITPLWDVKVYKIFYLMQQSSKSGGSNSSNCCGACPLNQLHSHDVNL